MLSARAARAGSKEQLVRALQEQIERLRPDTLLTFDPRHGTTCHPDHRATGELALLAAQAAGLPKSALLFVESAVAGVGGSTAPGFHQAVASDSRVQTISTAPAWAVPVHLMGMVYRSQYFASEVEAVRTIPQSGRTLSLIRASDVGLEVPGYAALCP